MGRCTANKHLTSHGFLALGRVTRKHALVLVAGVQDAFKLQIRQQASLDGTLWDFDLAGDRGRQNRV